MAEKVSYSYVQSKLTTARCCAADLADKLREAICVGNSQKVKEYENQLSILIWSIKALERYIPLGTTIDGTATTIESCFSEDTDHPYAQSALENVLEICSCEICNGATPDDSEDSNLILQDIGDYVLQDDGNKIIWFEG